MISFPMIPEVEINLLLLVFMGLSVGVLSGFVGVGGGFFVTLALIVLGLPANLAVGTSLIWVMGNSVIGAFRHGKMGNVDFRLALIMILATMSGIEVGVRILNWTKDIGLTEVAVLSISVFILFAVGTYTLIECSRRKKELDEVLKNGERMPADMRAKFFLTRKLQNIRIPPELYFKKSRVNASIWTLFTIGFFVGLTAGFIGVGGGLLMVPSLVYLFGIPSFLAIGTNLLQIIFTAAYGSIRHTMSGNVIILISLIILVASSLGTQFGASVTKYVRGVSARIILGIAIIMSGIGAALKLTDVLLEGKAASFQIGSIAVTFGGLGLTVLMILALYLIAIRYQKGQNIPVWMQSLVAKSN